MPAIGPLPTFAAALRYLPFVLAAAWLGRLVARHAVARAWLWVAVGQVALFGGSVVSRVMLSDVPGESACMMELSYVGWNPAAGTNFEGLFRHATWAQLPQLLAPVAAAWLSWRAGGVTPPSGPRTSSPLASTASAQ